MPVNLSVKNVSDQVAERLRRRAVRHHRSLQGELLAILESTVAEDESLSPEQVLAAVRASGVRGASESAAIVRADREARSRR